MRTIKKIANFLLAVYVAALVMGLAAWGVWAIMPARPLQPSEMLACGAKNNQPQANWVSLGGGKINASVSLADIGEAWRRQSYSNEAFANASHWLGNHPEVDIDLKAKWAAGYMPLYGPDGVKLEGRHNVAVYVVTKGVGRRTVFLLYPQC
jgi:hypothetical protein